MGTLIIGKQLHEHCGGAEGIRNVVFQMRGVEVKEQGDDVLIAHPDVDGLAGRIKAMIVKTAATCGPSFDDFSDGRSGRESPSDGNCRANDDSQATSYTVRPRMEQVIPETEESLPMGGC